MRPKGELRPQARIEACKVPLRTTAPKGDAALSAQLSPFSFQTMLCAPRAGAAVRGTCDEGRLEWVPYDSVLKREMPFTAKTVLRHYLRVGCRTRCIYGSVTEAEDSAFTELAEF